MKRLNKLPLGIIIMMIEHALMKTRWTHRIEVKGFSFPDKDEFRFEEDKGERIRVNVKDGERKYNYIFVWNQDEEEFTKFYDEDEYNLRKRQRNALDMYVSKFKRGGGKTEENKAALIEAFSIKDQDWTKAEQIIAKYEQERSDRISKAKDKDVWSDDFQKEWDEMVDLYIDKLRWIY